ncbi:hypothetical protein Hypma_004648 [Hypsizygus marmoreus]|uniref:Uncharacterized protein n=1 Tax=Hypsizygus marmoreus TaxID=39966 RepID=A0A369J7B3_HYPMA|nr:hypothetical protein Hypma_004648 [Hypsizygus marmoreus]
MYMRHLGGGVGHYRVPIPNEDDVPNVLPDGDEPIIMPDPGDDGSDEGKTMRKMTRMLTPMLTMTLGSKMEREGLWKPRTMRDTRHCSSTSRLSN